MGIILQFVYNGIFKFFCMPLFALMLIGRPRFLIGWVHKFINMKEPFFKLRLFRFIFFICCLTVMWSYYRKYTLDKMIEKFGHEQNKSINNNIHYLDEKLREAHLYERNTYMFFTLIILMIVVEKFCHSYFKLWAIEDLLVAKEKVKATVSQIKQPEEVKNVYNVVKDPKLKKIE